MEYMKTLRKLVLLGVSGLLIAILDEFEEDAENSRIKKVSIISHIILTISVFIFSFICSLKNLNNIGFDQFSTNYSNVLFTFASMISVLFVFVTLTHLYHLSCEIIRNHEKLEPTKISV